jgi:UV DNA damage endonuclease
MRPGVCCIVLGLEEANPPLKFQKMTFASFSKMERSSALEILGSRILNNMNVTLAAIRFCGERNYCYRLSSDLFPLLTYEKVGVGLEDLPQHDSILQVIKGIRSFLSEGKVRVSTHPDQFNTLASENEDSLVRTIRELNFQSWFMDQIGCPADHRSPINLHINSNKGGRDQIVDRLLKGMDRLDEDCRKRLVFENDDKTACWSVSLLVRHLHERTKVPITFDYLHHRCHPDGLSEEEALRACHSTWGGNTPLFHYSESRDEKNPRAHADLPSSSPNTYGLDFDLDFEFKSKDKAIELFEESSRRIPQSA